MERSPFRCGIGGQFRLAGTRARILGKRKGPERDLAPGPCLVRNVNNKIPSSRGLSTAFCFCIRLHLNLRTGSGLLAQPNISSFAYLLAKLYVLCIIIRESDSQSIRLRLHLIWMFEFRFSCNKNINIRVIIIP